MEPFPVFSLAKGKGVNAHNHKALHACDHADADSTLNVKKNESNLRTGSWPVSVSVL